MEFHSALLWPSYDYLHCAQREAGTRSYFCIFSKDTPLPRQWKGSWRQKQISVSSARNTSCVHSSPREGWLPNQGWRRALAPTGSQGDLCRGVCTNKVAIKVITPRWMLASLQGLERACWQRRPMVGFPGPFWVVILPRLAGDLKRNKSWLFTILRLFPFFSDLCS